MDSRPKRGQLYGNSARPGVHRRRCAERSSHIFRLRKARPYHVRHWNLQPEPVGGSWLRSMRRRLGHRRMPWLTIPTHPCSTWSATTCPPTPAPGLPQNAWSNVNRVDYNLSDKTTIYIRYAVQSETDQAGSVANSPYAGYNIGNVSFNNSLIVSMTHTFSPRFVSQSKLDFNRFNSVQPCHRRTA